MQREGPRLGRERGIRFLVTIAAFMIVVAGLREAKSLILPILMAAFLAILAMGPVSWLTERKVPKWLAYVMVFTAFIGAAVGVGYALGDSVADFSNRRPEFEAVLNERLGGVITFLDGAGLAPSRDDLAENVDSDQVVRMVGGALQAVGAVLSNLLFVALTLGFMLAEAAGLPNKIRMAIGDPGADISRLTRILAQINTYLWVKTQVSFITGLMAWGLCAACDIEYAFLWGLVAYVLNYIPQLGSFIAAVPPILVGYVQHDWPIALGVLIGYIVINVLMGSIIEPRWMGRTFGLSTLIVFLSLLFWGFVWGPVGMFLSVPLTMVVKIMLEQSDDLGWIAVLMGSGREMRERVEAAESGIYEQPPNLVPDDGSAVGASIKTEPPLPRKA